MRGCIWTGSACVYVARPFRRQSSARSLPSCEALSSVAVPGSCVPSSQRSLSRFASAKVWAVALGKNDRCEEAMSLALRWVEAPSVFACSPRHPEADLR